MRTLLTITLFLLLGMSQAHAQDRVVEQDRLDDVMMNVGNQFIYSFFGKDILLIYLTDRDDREVVRSATDTDLASLSAPFNPLSGKFLLGGLSIIYALSVGYFVLRLSLFLVEQGWLYQRHDEAPLTETETRGIIVKMVILGGLVVIPIPLSNQLTDDTFYTSSAIGGLFFFLGHSHEVADESMRTLIQKQRQTLQTITLPAADSKQYDLMAVNEFFTCMRLAGNQRTDWEIYSRIEFYKTDPNSIEGVASVGNCSLNVSFGIESQSDEKLKRILAQDPSVNLVPGVFQEAQKEIFEVVLKDAFETALNTSDGLSIPIHSSDFLAGSSVMSRFTGEQLSASELEDWGRYCDSIKSIEWDLHEKISGYDRALYHILSARCMSRDLTSKMLYPDNYSSMDNILSGGLQRQKTLALCVDEASLAQIVGQSRFSAQYEAGAGGVSSDEVETIALNSCLASICSESSLQNGGLYACSNAIDLYESHLRDEQLMNRGVMTLGFYMFNLFIHQPPNSLAKEVYNRLNFTFTDGPVEPIEGDEPYLTLLYEMPELKFNSYEKNNIMEELGLALERDGLPAYAPVSEMSDFPDWIGYSRLLTCAQNPLQVSGGYVCNNLPQEFSRFGFSMLQNAITVKALMTMGNATNLIRMPRGPDGAVGDGNSNIKMAIVSSAMTFAAHQSGIINTMYDKMSGFSFAGTDEFGHLDRAQMEAWAEVPLIAGIFALGRLSSESGIIKSIEYVLLTVLLMGIVFAFLMPLFPMIMVISALTKFVFILLKAIVFTGFRLTDAIFERDPDFIGEQIDRLWAEWLSVILKLPLLVVGIVLAWLMSNVIVSHVLASIDLSVPTNDGVQGVLDLFVIIIVSGVVIFIIYNMVLTVIESFYDFTVEWILGTLTNNPFAERKAAGWKDSKDVLGLIGR